MRLSIVIPVYNVERYVGKCLDSLLHQDLDPNDYEILIINDGSTDDSLTIIESYAKINKQIKIINRKNEGVGSARNCGIENAKGKYIYFIDSDDYLISNCLNKLIEICDNHDLEILTFLSTRFTSVSSDDKFIPETIDVKDNMLSSIVSGEEYLAKLYYRNEVWWYVINREFLRKIGVKFEERRYLEDAAFTLGLFINAQRIAHLKLNTHRYRSTPESIMTSRAPGHYLKVIRDMQNAATAFAPIITLLENKTSNSYSLERIKAKQQSLVFFSMIRMLKSTMSLDEVKFRLNQMTAINAYPLNVFPGIDYDKFSYKILASLFNKKRRFLILFKAINPLLKIRYKF